MGQLNLLFSAKQKINWFILQSTTTNHNAHFCRSKNKQFFRSHHCVLRTKMSKKTRPSTENLELTSSWGCQLDLSRLYHSTPRDITIRRTIRLGEGGSNRNTHQYAREQGQGAPHPLRPIVFVCRCCLKIDLPHLLAFISQVSTQPWKICLSRIFPVKTHETWKENTKRKFPGKFPASIQLTKILTSHAKTKMGVGGKQWPFANPLPDWRDYKVRDYPEMVKHVEKCKELGLKDPWVRWACLWSWIPATDVKVKIGLEIYKKKKMPIPGFRGEFLAPILWYVSNALWFWL